MQIVIDDNHNITRGHFQPPSDTTSVTKARWQEAQRYESRTWQEATSAKSDRNEYHAKMFADYAAIRGRRFASGIELGCGPFTNMRFILEHCTVESLELLDPLINEYTDHPNNAYSKMNARLVCNTIEAHTGHYDLVVMVNVIEHCQDAGKVLANIHAMLSPGGVLVFHERLLSSEAVDILTTQLYDAGHPLRVGAGMINDFLRDYTSIYIKAKPVKRNFRGVQWEETELYYIGMEKNSPA